MRKGSLRSALTDTLQSGKLVVVVTAPLPRAAVAVTILKIEPGT